MPPRNAFLRRLRNHFRVHATIWQVVLILGGMLFLAGGFIVASKNLMEGRERPFQGPDDEAEGETASLVDRPQERRLPQPVGLERFPTDRVVELLLEAQGGAEALEAIQSLRLRGRLALHEEGGAERDFSAVLVYRRPDQLRYRYATTDRAMTAGMSGGMAWRQFEHAGETSPVEELPPSDRALLQLDLETLRPLSSTLADRSRLRVREAEESPGRPAYVLSFTTADGADHALHFDRQNGLLFRREVSLAPPGADLLHIRLEYEDHRYVGEAVFPFLIRVSLDGVPRSVLTLEQVETNIGTLPFFFDPPEDAG